MEQRAYGSKLGSAFGMPDAPTLVTGVLLKSTLAVTELRCDQPNSGKSASVLPCEDAYHIVLHVHNCSETLYFEGRRKQRESHSGGATSIYDLRRSPVTDIHGPYHSLVFYLPRTALDTVSSEAGAQRMGDLRHGLGSSLDDPVTRHLLLCLIPALAKPHEAPALFLDHVALAMTAHMASLYGSMSRAAGMPRSGLAPWQERRAKELISANLAKEIPLSRLATECGLSVRHFSRAFRRSTGVPPHRWLLLQRVERARNLLKNRVLSLTDITTFCGFADQSHFTRVFTAMMGISPGAWRRKESSAIMIKPE
jgi:AraC-like DNA-binding protein